MLGQELVRRVVAGNRLVHRRRWVVVGRDEALVAVDARLLHGNVLVQRRFESRRMLLAVESPLAYRREPSLTREVHPT